MKKLLVLSILIITALIFTACGTSDTEKDSLAKDNTTAKTETVATDKAETNDEGTAEPTEPTADTVCASCNMVVYPKDHEMGMFTAQGVTEDGENIFFDDIGCVLNYERKFEKKLDIQWVRDYETLAWTELDAATPVKTDLKTPMKWGYAFFDSKEKATKFVEENPNINPSITDWTTVDEAAAERLKKMQAQQKQNGSNGMNMDMDNEDM